MDNKISYVLKELNKGVVETEENFVNPFSDNLTVHNAVLSSQLKKPEFRDGQNKIMKTDFVPVRNGADKNFAIYLNKQVPPGREFLINTRAELGEDFLQQHIKEENGIFFWKHFFASGRKTYLLYNISLAGNMSIIHAEGIEPSFIKKNEIVWELSLEPNDIFQSLLMFRINS